MNNITKDVNEQIILLRKSGMNIREVAEELSITYDKAKYALKKAGLQDYKYKRTCEQCNEEFESIRQSSKFCSEKCRVKYYKQNNGEKKICVYCRKEVYNYNDNKSYCTPLCKHTHAVSKKRIVLKRWHCKNSNKEHRTIKGRRKKFCDERCRHAYTYVGISREHNIKCKECGQHKTVSLNRKIFCSKKCYNKFSWRYNELKRREKIFSNGNVHRDISIERLLKRDGVLCYLCNEKVVISDDTNAPYYPSIEHVIPISKGGTHTWDNVKLAHRKCNWEKRDEIII